MTRDEAREKAIEWAEDAGLDPDTVDAVRDTAMSVFEEGMDEDDWRDAVDSVIQGHACP